MQIFYSFLFGLASASERGVGGIWAKASFSLFQASFNSLLLQDQPARSREKELNE